jgi:hypothetical protein
VDALEQRKKLYSGFSDALSRAIEFVAVPLIFAWLGHLLDGRLDTGIVFTVALATFAIVGMSLRSWFGYVEAMKAEEARAPWRKQ